MMTHNRKIAALWVAILAAFLVGLGTAAGARSPLQADPSGQYVDRTESGQNETFSPDDKVVATYYFYWYDNRTKAHVVTPDGHDLLTDHPPTLEGFTYKSVDWHRGQLEDMLDAGIDVVLPVYWGDAHNRSWSIPGLKNLVQACREMEEDGVEPPRIGMFYDTTALMREGRLKQGGERPDLTTEFGRELFYRMIRDFYSVIPPRFRARKSEKPIAWLYSATFASDHNQKTLDYADRMFRRHFGGKDLHIVREVSWSVSSENVYAWGAALNGPSFHGVLCLGPGYDDSAVPGRTTPVKPRENGAYYRRSWQQVLAFAALKDRNTVAVETWNEYHEGTDIAESREFGRKYIEMTARYARMFRAGEMPEDFGGRRYIESDTASTDFTGGSAAIEFVEGVADGPAEKMSRDGVTCLKSAESRFDYSCLYFAVNHFYKAAHDLEECTLEVTYYDGAPGTEFRVEYDSATDVPPHDGAYRGTKSVALQGSEEWKKATFHLSRVRFAGRQNGGADFRLWINKPGLLVKSVAVRPDSE